MIDLRRITGFEWDSGKALKSKIKHGVGASEAEQIFFNDPLLVLEDEKHSQTESRFHALGTTDDGRFLHVTFTVRGNGDLIRVISARDMHRKERSHYEQTEEDS